MRATQAIQPTPPEREYGFKQLAQHAWNYMNSPVAAAITFFGIIALMICAALSGCATIEKNPATAKLATQYAVAKFIENSAAEKRAERKARIVTIATDIKAAAASQSVSLSSLQILAYEKIDKLALSPADTVLAKGLVDFIAEELKAKIDAKLLSPKDTLILASVMDWIIQAAS